MPNALSPFASTSTALSADEQKNKETLLQKIAKDLLHIKLDVNKIIFNDLEKIFEILKGKNKTLKDPQNDDNERMHEAYEQEIVELTSKLKCYEDQYEDLLIKFKNSNNDLEESLLRCRDLLLLNHTDKDELDYLQRKIVGVEGKVNEWKALLKKLPFLFEVQIVQQQGNESFDTPKKDDLDDKQQEQDGWELDILTKSSTKARELARSVEEKIYPLKAKDLPLLKAERNVAYVKLEKFLRKMKIKVDVKKSSAGDNVSMEAEILLIKPDAELAQSVVQLVASNDDVDRLRKNITAVIEENVSLRKQLSIPEGDAMIDYDQLKKLMKDIEDVLQKNKELVIQTAESLKDAEEAFLMMKQTEDKRNALAGGMNVLSQDLDHIIIKAKDLETIMNEIGKVLLCLKQHSQDLWDGLQKKISGLEELVSIFLIQHK